MSDVNKKKEGKFWSNKVSKKEISEFFDEKNPQMQFQILEEILENPCFFSNWGRF